MYKYFRRNLWDKREMMLDKSKHLCQKNLLRKFAEWLLTIATGSIVCCYSLQLSKVKLLPLSARLKNMLQSGNIPEMDFGMPEILIFMIGIFSLMTVPLFVCRNKNAGQKIMVLLFVLFLDAGAAIVTIARGEILPFYTVVIWLSSVYVSWLVMDVMRKNKTQVSR